jgi:hypothetical protein
MIEIRRSAPRDRDLIGRDGRGYSGPRADERAKRAMIGNGLYHITVEMLDGIKGGNQGVMVVRDGTLRGGDSFLYAYGTYTVANGKWKGEVTNQEHTRSFGERPVWEGKIVTIGFTGTYTDETAETDGIALAGKQSIRFKSRLWLLVPD